MLDHKEGRDNASKSHRTNKCEFIKTSHMRNKFAICELRASEISISLPG